MNKNVSANDKCILSKKHLKSLEENEQQFRLLYEKAPLGIAIVGKDLKIEKVNNYFLNMFGYQEKDIIGKSFVDFTFKEDIKKDLVNAKKLFKNKIPFYTIEKRFLHKNKSLIWINLTATVIRNDNNEPLYGLAIVENINERKKLENLKEEFLDVASHELKTPVTTLKLLIDSITKYTKSVDNDIYIKKSYIKVFSREIDRLKNLTEQLLNFSRIENNRLKLNNEKFYICNLIKDVIDITNLSLNKRRITIIKNCKYKVIADKIRIEQVIYNLITNAIKFSPDNTEINIEIKNKNKKIIVSVIDKGKGISKKRLNTLFSKFYQVDNKGPNGFGLGLFISKEIINAHNEKIWVKSKPGKGSTFSFSLKKAD